MKKTILFFGILFIFLFLFSGIVQADLVPCGQGSPTIPNPTPPPPTLPNPSFVRCELSHFFTLLLNLYNYVLLIGTSLAGLGIVMGGIVLIFSAGNPNLATTARRILWGSLLGIVLIWCSWLIIHTVMWILGYTGPI